MSSKICTKCGGVQQESYTYIRNQPKNDSKVVLGTGPLYLGSQPTNTFEQYNYAIYKRERHEEQPSKQEEQAWPGVI